MNSINELKLQPVYNTQEDPLSYCVTCNVPRWLEGLDKWSEITMLYFGTKKECEKFIETYNKEVVPENNLMLENLK